MKKLLTILALVLGLAGSTWASSVDPALTIDPEGNISAPVSFYTPSMNGGGISGLTGANFTDAVPMVFQLSSNGAQFVNQGTNTGLSILTGLPSSTATVVNISGKTVIGFGSTHGSEEYSLEIASGAVLLAGGLRFSDGTTQYTAAGTSNVAESTFSFIYTQAINNDLNFNAFASTVSMTTGANRVMACASWDTSTSGGGPANSWARFLVDGELFNPLQHDLGSPMSNYFFTIHNGLIDEHSFCAMSQVLSAGSHNFVPEFRNGINGGQTTVNGNGIAMFFSVYEIK